MQVCQPGSRQLLLHGSQGFRSPRVSRWSCCTGGGVLWVLSTIIERLLLLPGQGNAQSPAGYINPDLPWMTIVPPLYWLCKMLAFMLSHTCIHNQHAHVLTVTLLYNHLFITQQIYFYCSDRTQPGLSSHCCSVISVPVPVESSSSLHSPPPPLAPPPAIARVQPSTTMLAFSCNAPSCKAKSSAVTAQQRQVRG